LRPFLLAPLGAVAVLSIGGMWIHTTRIGPIGIEDFLSLVVIFTLFSYVAALLVGVPIFLVLRRLEWMSRLSCAIGGGIGGLLFFLIPYSIWYGLLRTLTTRTSEMVMSMIAGITAGLLFGQLRIKGDLTSNAR